MVNSLLLAKPPHTVLIVGGGEFGAATAEALIQGPYKGNESLVTILDRAVEPPAIDAASSDYNKIIRSDYTDPFYAHLACTAIHRWREAPYANRFHESGIVVGSNKDHEQRKYVFDSLEVNTRPEMQTQGKHAFELRTARDIQDCYPRAVPTGPLDNLVAYKNECGGWAESRGACVDALARCREAGVLFASGEASTLIYATKDGRKDVAGVMTKGGQRLMADLVILAAGAWTSKLLPSLGTELLPTGQTVGTIQLTPEETARYRDIPVSFYLDTGFYCFPPTADGVFKFAIHGQGWLDPHQTTQLPSTPRTVLTPGFALQEIPSASALLLRSYLTQLFPELGAKHWKESRLCWYTDRPSGDFLLDFHPEHPSLFLCTGGSGHGFKFMPVIGELALKALDGKLTAQEKSYFSYGGDESRIDKSRGEKHLERSVLPPGESRAKL